jgi:hypothetical protein
MHTHTLQSVVKLLHTSAAVCFESCLVSWGHELITVCHAQADRAATGYRDTAPTRIHVLHATHGDSVQGKGLQAALVVRGMSSGWCRPSVVRDLEAKAATGGLRNACTFCARLWARILLAYNATGSHRLSAAPGDGPELKAEAIDGYVRCALSLHRLKFSLVPAGAGCTAAWNSQA